MNQSEKRLYRYTTRLNCKCGVSKMHEGWQHDSDLPSVKTLYRMPWCVTGKCFKTANLSFIFAKIRH